MKLRKYFYFVIMSSLFCFLFLPVTSLAANLHETTITVWKGEEKAAAEVSIVKDGQLLITKKTDDAGVVVFSYEELMPFDSYEAVVKGEDFYFVQTFQAKERVNLQMNDPVSVNWTSDFQPMIALVPVDTYKKYHADYGWETTASSFVVERGTYEVIAKNDAKKMFAIHTLSTDDDWQFLSEQLIDVAADVSSPHSITLYNEQTDRVLGDHLRGTTLFVTPGAYYYTVAIHDAPWSYLVGKMDNRHEKTAMTTSTVLRVDRRIDEVSIEPDTASILNYAEKIQVPLAYDLAHTQKMPKRYAFYYTKHQITDRYGNELYRMNKEQSFDTFRQSEVNDRTDTYPEYQVVRLSDGKEIFTRQAPLFLTNGFWWVNREEITTGKYMITLRLPQTTWTKDVSSSSLTMDVVDEEKREVRVKNGKQKVPRYLLQLYRVENGELVQFFSETHTKGDGVVSLLSDLPKSSQHEGNVLRLYVMDDEAYTLYYQRFTDWEEIETIDISDRVRVDIEATDYQGQPLSYDKKEWKVSYLDEDIQQSQSLSIAYDRHFYVSPGQYAVEGRYATKEGTYFLRSKPQQITGPTVLHLDGSEAARLSFDAARTTFIPMSETNNAAFETVMAEGDLFVTKGWPITLFAATEHDVGDEVYTRYHELLVNEPVIDDQTYRLSGQYEWKQDDRYIYGLFEKNGYRLASYTAHSATDAQTRKYLYQDGQLFIRAFKEDWQGRFILPIANYYDFTETIDTFPHPHRKALQSIDWPLYEETWSMRRQ